MSNHRFLSLALISFLVLLSDTAYATESTTTSQRPQIGLVLSGGGAKGAAHIGVLEVLEEHRIPVDIVTGTSMGAYVGGMAALGLSATEIKERTFGIDWNQGYIDKSDRNELLLRKKRNEDDYQLRAEVGITPSGEYKPKPGAVLGQTMAALLRQATQYPAQFASFDELPIPYRAVATDMESVSPVILASGDLTQAMQASMSVPGALKGVEWEGKYLVDGGIVNNMPVDVALEMGADHIIAIDLRDPLYHTNELKSVLAVVEQLTTYMTNSSSDKQVSYLQPERDTYLQPELSFMTAPDFDKMQQAYEAGRNVALTQIESLKRYQLTQQQYDSYKIQKAKKRTKLFIRDAYFIDKIQLDNRSQLNESLIRELLSLEENKAITTAEIETAVKKLYARNDFEKVTYTIDEEGDETVLNMVIKEKSWGPGFLNFKFGLEDNFSNRSEYGIGAQYTLTNITDLGGEWTTAFLAGSWKKLSTELYFPVDVSQKWAITTGAELTQEVRQFYFSSDNIFNSPRGGATFESDVDYDQNKIHIGLDWNWHNSGALTFGYLGLSGHYHARSVNFEQDVYGHGPYAQFTFDNLDNFFFPSKGISFDSQVGFTGNTTEYNNSSINDDVLYYSASLIKPITFNRHTFTIKASGGGSNSDELLPTYLQDLGGLHNLSGFNRYELNGRYSLFAAMIYRYRLLDNDFGLFSSPIYLGGSVEQGGVWDSGADINQSSTFTSGSIYLGVDSIIGPVFLGYGHSNEGNSSFYLSVGSGF